MITNPGLITPPFSPVALFRVGAYYCSQAMAVSATAAVTAADTAYYQPIYLPEVLDRMTIDVTVGAAGAARLALYSSLGAAPSLIEDLGEVDTTDAAVLHKTFTARQFPRAFVWMACVFNATPTVRVGTGGQASMIGGPNTNGGFRGLYGSHTYGPWPAIPPAVVTYSTVGPLMFLSKAP